METIELRKYLRDKLLELTDDDVYLDVGACIGTASNLINKGTCYAFEPSDRNYELLVEATWFKPNIVPLKIAMYGEQVFYEVMESEKQIGMDRIAVSNVGQLTTTIDLFCEDKKNIKLIKVDAEGSDYQIFLGAKETIIKHKPIFIIEKNKMLPCEVKDLCKWFEENNYTKLFFSINIAFEPK